MKLLEKLWGCFFSWRVAPSSEKELGGADVILALAHGEKGDPSNIAIAQVVVSLCQSLDKPAVVQHQIGYSLPHEFTRGRVYRMREQGGYLNTCETLSLMALLCKHEGWRRAIIVAHRYPYWRAVRCAERLGFVVFAVDATLVPHSPHSVQWWIRSLWLLAPYEILARWWFLVHGWI